MEDHASVIEGYQRLEQAMARLAEAQVQTEAALQQLARQCEGVVCDIEDTAYIVLYDALKRELGWEVGVLGRTRQQWNGEAEEINIFGRATDPAHPDRTIWIMGEAKHNLTLWEADRFAQQIQRARQHLEGGVRCLFCLSSPVRGARAAARGGDSFALLLRPLRVRCDATWAANSCLDLCSLSAQLTHCVANCIPISVAPTWLFLPALPVDDG
jgi:hypothetical protein